MHKKHYQTEFDKVTHETFIKELGFKQGLKGAVRQSDSEYTETSPIHLFLQFPSCSVPLSLSLPLVIVSQRTSPSQHSTFPLTIVLS